MLHDNIRAMGDLWRQSHCHEDYPRDRDEPCVLFFTAQAEPSPPPVVLTIGGQTHPLWLWEQGICISSEPTPEEIEIMAENGLEFELQTDGTYFIVNPRFVEYGE